MENTEKAVLTVREVAKILRVNVTTTYQLVRREDFPCLRIGRKFLIPKESFYRWLAQAGQGKTKQVL